jgi:predicted ATPase
MITKLTVRAFKGLREFSIEPRRINLLIGANGTGKTNFADLVDFIARLSRRGLSETVAEFGGLPRVRTRKLKGPPYKFKIEFWLGEDQSRGIQRVYYSFTLAQTKEIKVQEETLDAVVYKRLVSGSSGEARFDIDRIVNIHFKREGRTITEQYTELGDPAHISIDDDQELVLSTYSRIGEFRTLSDYLSSWRVYNVDPMIAQMASRSSTSITLDRYGANTVSVIAQMLRDERVREKLLSDLREIVPYIQDIQPDTFSTIPTLRFVEQDTGVGFRFHDMSEGTIRLLGLFAVLYQPIPPAVMVIEEPENTLHAYATHYFLKLVRQVVMSYQFASQVFLTSHSPTIVDEVLNLEAMRETNNQTACFVTQRKPGEPSIVSAPESVMQAIAKNLGRPSDFQREGSFGDEPIQPELLEALEDE